MRNLFIIAMMALATVMLWIGAAIANPFADVPTGHWAYEAVDYLQQQSLVEGWPDGHYKGDRLLTRYEFAQAIARVVKKLGETGNTDGRTNALVAQLKDEFAKELAELDNRVKLLEEVSAFDGERITGLEQDVKKVNDWVAATDKNLAILLKTKWSGDFRYRFTMETSDLPSSTPIPNTNPAANQSNSGAINNAEDRFRQRIRFRFGATTTIDDNTSVTWRLATGRDSSGTSANYTLGLASGAGSTIGLDMAYVKWAPWGTKTADGIAKPDVFWLYGGLTPRPEWSYSSLMFDGDLAMHGITAQYLMENGRYALTAWYRLNAEHSVGKDGKGEWDDDTYNYGAQIAAKDLFDVKDLQAYVGYYGWQNLDRLGTAHVSNPCAGGNFTVPNWDPANDPKASDGKVTATGNFNDIISMNDGKFDVLNVGGKYNFTTNIFNGIIGPNTPIEIFGDFAYNTRGYKANVATLHDLQDSDRIGWIAGMVLNKASSKVPGSWQIGAQYGDIGFFATPGMYADSDYLGVGNRGLNASFVYQMSSSATVAYNFFAMQRNIYYYGNDINTSLRGWWQNTNYTHFVDFVWKF